MEALTFVLPKRPRTEERILLLGVYSIEDYVVLIVSLILNLITMLGLQ